MKALEVLQVTIKKWVLIVPFDFKCKCPRGILFYVVYLMRN